jgi:glutamine synthetase
VADSLKQLADELEKLEHGDFESLTSILSGIVKGNKQVLFEGNGYSEEWHAEAARRKLPNNRTTVDALPSLTTDTAKKLFSSFGVLSERELASRVEINWERYVKISDIEASCAADIASTMIVPATARYLGQLAAAPSSRGLNSVCERVSRLADSLVDAVAALGHAQHEAHQAGSVQAEAKAFATEVIPAQQALREVVDELETVVADDLWPLPKYRELLFQY